MHHFFFFVPPIGNRQHHRPLLRLQQRQLHRAAHRQPGHRSGSRRVLLQRHQPVRQPRGEVCAAGAQPPGPPVAPPRGSGWDHHPHHHHRRLWEAQEAGGFTRRWVTGPDCFIIPLFLIRVRVWLLTLKNKQTKHPLLSVWERWEQVPSRFRVSS